jgi:(p)ppGpp synthase/HD superfamily hydrolase
LRLILPVVRRRAPAGEGRCPISTLEKAISIAADAHQGQRDKTGSPFILHPLRVMLRVSEADERIVAALHDVVEDSDLTLDDLRQAGFSRAVVTAVEAMTRREGEAYDDFVLRAGADPIGRAVKRADLLDNLEQVRSAVARPSDDERTKRYRRALGLLDSGAE